MKRKTITLLCGLMCLTVSGSILSCSTIPKELKREIGSASDRKAIEVLFAAWADAYNSRNADAIADLFIEDGDAIFHDGPRLIGKEAIRKSGKESFASSPPTKRIEIVVTSVRFLKHDVAIVVAEGTHNQGEIRNDRGTDVLVRVGGVWRVASARVYSAQKPTGG